MAKKTALQRAREEIRKRIEREIKEYRFLAEKRAAAQARIEDGKRPTPAQQVAIDVLVDRYGSTDGEPLEDDIPVGEIATKFEPTGSIASMREFLSSPEPWAEGADVDLFDAIKDEVSAAFDALVSQAFAEEWPKYESQIQAISEEFES